MEQHSINFLRDSFSHHRSLRNSLDQKASILLGISGIIFSLSIGHFPEIQFIVLAIGAFLAALLSVLAIFLPFRGKFEGRSSLMCWSGFSDKNFNQYKEGLNKVFASEEETFEEYIKEIWALSDHSLKPKTKRLKWASLSLILGLLAGFILFFV